MNAGCTRPLGLPELLAYWLGDLAAERLDDTEEHLLACGACVERLDELVAIADGVRGLAGAGALGMVVTPSFLDRARRDGLRTRIYQLDPGGRVQCTATPDDDLVVARLRADLSGVQRLDFVAQREGENAIRVEDVPIDPEGGEVLFTEPIDYLRTLSAGIQTVRLLAVDPQGNERVLGEYTFQHTPFAG